MIFLNKQKRKQNFLFTILGYQTIYYKRKTRFTLFPRGKRNTLSTKKKNKIPFSPTLRDLFGKLRI